MSDILKSYVNENKGYSKLNSSKKKSRALRYFVTKNFKIFLYIFILIVAVIFLVQKLQTSAIDRQNTTAVINVSENALELKDNELRNKLNCTDADFILEIIETDQFYIVKNYIKGSRYFRCHESVTIATNGEYTYLYNLIPLIEKWRAPVSLAVYGPGRDLMASLNVIYYLRNCNIQKDLIRELVTFHIFFDVKDESLTSILTLYETLESTLNCSSTSVYLGHTRNDTFSLEKQLKYPINLARNIGRTPAMTHFVFSSDIELYPSVNFVSQFLNMVNNDEGKFLRGNNAFVLPIFEIVPNVTMPETKQEFVKLYNEEKIFTFHSLFCTRCHTIPELDRWLNDTADEMHITAVSKRQGNFYHWEPFFVGTNNDPLFDERLTSEGAADKMPQAYAMCLLDYDFHILSNAFVIHRNGIKRKEDVDTSHTEERKNFINSTIVPEMEAYYGNRNGCFMF